MSHLLALYCGTVFLFLAVAAVGKTHAVDVQFDGRSFIIDGERTLLLGGSFHYPRAPRSEWPAVLQQLKDNGINLIQTYVFWDIHEPENDVWHFPSSDTSSEDLVGFIREAQKYGFFVHLRISGYVCAEWNYGGLPVWLRGLNSTLRTYDEVWLEQLAQFFEKTIDVVRDAQLLAVDGGPIIMMQIENEYGNMEPYYYTRGGAKYVQWLSEYAESLDIGGIPWVMCQQGEGVGTSPSERVINACNGFYCDNWISRHTASFPNQPHMWTENWPGWFQNWGEPVPHRPAVDVAFSVARWVAKGGSYMTYYMAFGGSSFARSVGGPLIVTSYDYDVQVNEYTFRAEPKFTLLQRLHSTLYVAWGVMMAEAEVPAAVPLPTAPQFCESHTYRSVHTNTAGTLGDVGAGGCVAFLSNYGEEASCLFPLEASATGAVVEVPAWSVSIVMGANCTEEVFNTKKSVQAGNALVSQPVDGVRFLGDFDRVLPEPVPGSTADAAAVAGTVTIDAAWPLEQLSITADSTDYLWYTTAVSADTVNAALATASEEGAVELSFLLGTAGGGLAYIYVNGLRVAATLGDAGAPPVNGDLKKWSAAKKATLSNHSLSIAPRSSKIAVNISISPNEEFSLDILSVSMGLQNYGPYLENIQVGITSNVTINGVVLNGGFKHTVGLIGEVLNVVSTDNDSLRQWKVSSSCGKSSVCWYRNKFSVPVAADSGAARHLALDIGTSQNIGKGALWINDCMLGRFWNVTAEASATQRDCADQCGAEEYVGSYSGERCRTGCGQYSQRLYKIPTECVMFGSDSVAGQNTITVLEELGGSPDGISIVEVQMMDLE